MANRKTHRTILIAAMSAIALVAAACRGGDGGGGGGEGELTTGVGVTEEACPNSPNQDNGCIYLGIISDLTSGPFAALAVPITDAQKAFWKRVNEEGGIQAGDQAFDVDVTSNIKDNKYNPETHRQVYQEIKGEVLGLAQTLGSPTTAAIINDLDANSVVSAPASWTSAWEVDDVIVESGTNYCFESMNSVDYAVEEFDAKSVMAVHYAGDYGEDAAGGAKVAAEANNLDFRAVETGEGQEEQTGAIQAIVSQKPDVVILTTGPTDAAVIVGQTAARGYQGKFIGTSPTWNPELLKSPAAAAIKKMYLQSAPWASFGGDSPGHEAMRKALGNVQANDGYTSGWVWSYPLKAALERAGENGDLSREGLLEAAKSLETVDYEGMLPEEAGNYSGEPNDAVFRQSLINKVDDETETGVSVEKDLFTGPTAEGYEFTEPCF